jgi:hypothetical protein
MPRSSPCDGNLQRLRLCRHTSGTDPNNKTIDHIFLSRSGKRWLGPGSDRSGGSKAAQGRISERTSSYQAAHLTTCSSSHISAPIRKAMEFILDVSFTLRDPKIAGKTLEAAQKRRLGVERLYWITRTL